MNNYVRFVITGDARTGSNMLAQALNTNPEVRCFREIFHRRMNYVDFFVEGFDPNNVDDVSLRDRDPVGFLRTRIFDSNPEHFRAVGFKYLYGHFWGHDVLTEYLVSDAPLRVIHLKRRNMMRSLVSVRLAEMTNRWIEDWGLARKRPLYVRAASALMHPARTLHRLRGDKESSQEQAKPSVSFTREECERWFFRTNHEVRRVDEMFKDHELLEVWYEDMLEDRDSAFGEVQRFLGVAPVPLEVTLRRQNPEPLRELIANYDELRAAFAGQPEEAFFDD